MQLYGCVLNARRCNDCITNFQSILHRILRLWTLAYDDVLSMYVGIDSSMQEYSKYKFAFDFRGKLFKIVSFPRHSITQYASVTTGTSKDRYSQLYCSFKQKKVKKKEIRYIWPTNHYIAGKANKDRMLQFRKLLNQKWIQNWICSIFRNAS